MLDSARFVLSRSAMLKQYQTAEQLADQVSFSAKTNFKVAELLEQSTSCMFSLHSMESLEKIKDHSRVWFLAQAWDREEIDKLIKSGVRNFVVDNEPDLNTLLDYLASCQVSVNLMLRIRMKEHTVHTGRHFVYGMYSHQFNRLAPELRKHPQINQLGLHFHRKSQNIGEWSLKYELEQIIDRSVLEQLDWVCIGGGIPVRYKNFRVRVQDHIFEEIRKLRKWLAGYNIKMLIEPGRFISAPCIKLKARIKNIYDNNIIINCSVYNSAIDTFVVHHKLEVEGELPEGQGKAYTIKGKTPCSMDIFRYRVFLDNPQRGDEIVFLNAGAYNFSSDFCNLKKLKTEVVE